MMTGDSINEERLQHLRLQYTELINHHLPAHFTHPVRFNHCFARIILDWTFGGCWYEHLPKKLPAYKQLSEQQLDAAINRMQQWLKEPQLLADDNNLSLSYRRKT